MDASLKVSALLEHLGINAKVLSERIGYQRPQIIYDILKGKTKRISEPLADKIISVFPDISKRWLIMGEGEMLADEAGEHDLSPLDVGSCVPLLPVSALANPLTEYTAHAIADCDCKTILSPVSGAELAIAISGDSMEPQFRDGEIVFLKRINDAAFIPYGSPLVIDTVNGAFLKLVYPHADGDFIEARSCNTAYPILEIPKSAIIGMYRVLSATKFFTTL